MKNVVDVNAPEYEMAKRNQTMLSQRIVLLFSKLFFESNRTFYSKLNFEPIMKSSV